MESRLSAETRTNSSARKHPADRPRFGIRTRGLLSLVRFPITGYVASTARSYQLQARAGGASQTDRVPARPRFWGRGRVVSALACAARFGGPSPTFV